MERSSAKIADTALREWFQECGKPELGKLTWDDYHAMLGVVTQSFEHMPERMGFEYVHPVRLQDSELGLGKPYSAPVSYSDTQNGAEPVIAIGGLINTKHRFDFLSNDAYRDLRVIAIDLCGRGGSGWLAEQTDYSIDTHVEQILQFMDYLDLPSCTLLGSSLGGSIAIRFADHFPDRVKRIILNDSGPYIPKKRRRQRSIAIARHYAFRTPAEMFRKTAISMRHSGATLDASLFHSQHYKTRWSDEENGRIYRHDIRAMLAYRAAATKSLNQWEYWDQIHCPVLLLHGLESDALSHNTIDRMRNNPLLSVIHVHDAGHTPSLSDGELNQWIAQWVLDDIPYDQDRYYQNPDRYESIIYNA